MCFLAVWSGHRGRLIGAIFVLALSACATRDRPPPFRMPDTEFEAKVSRGWPFRVETAAYQFGYDDASANALRTQFIQPIANSPHASRIECLRIEILSPIAENQNCGVKLKGQSGYTWFQLYDPGAVDPLAAARAGVLSVLNGKRAGR
jgi:hypothetical protein